MMSRSWTTSPTAGITTSPRNVCPNAGVATLPDSVIGRLSLQLSGSGQLQLKGLEHIQTWIWSDKDIEQIQFRNDQQILIPAGFLSLHHAFADHLFSTGGQKEERKLERENHESALCAVAHWDAPSDHPKKLLPWESEWIDSKIQDIQVSCDTVDLQLPICIKELTQSSEYSSLWSHCRHETDVRSCSMCFYAWFAACQGKQLGEFVEPNS